MSTIGNNIKRYRSILNLTLEDVASKVNLSRQTLSRYETGVISNIPSDTIEALADVLQVNPWQLMGWDVQEPAINIDDELLKELCSNERKLCIVKLISRMSDDQLNRLEALLDAALLLRHE